MITSGQTQKVTAQIKAAQALVEQFQATYDIGSQEWHALETIDDRLHEALATLGD